MGINRVDLSFRKKIGNGKALKFKLHDFFRNGPFVTDPQSDR